MSAVEFIHAKAHAGKELEAFVRKNHPDFKKRQRLYARRLLKAKGAAAD